MSAEKFKPGSFHGPDEFKGPRSLADAIAEGRKKIEAKAMEKRYPRSTDAEVAEYNALRDRQLGERNE